MTGWLRDTRRTCTGNADEGMSYMTENNAVTNAADNAANNAALEADTVTAETATTTYERLRALVHDDWEAAVTHRFVRELVDETIDPDVLRDYLIQDYQFSEDFLSLLGQVLASADTMKAKVRYAAQLGFIAADEDTYFQDRFAQYGVSEDQILHPELAPASLGFKKLYTDTIETRSYKDGLAVLVVAESLYLDWAERATDHGRKLPVKPEHRGWVDVHRGEFFSEWVDFLIAELNRVASADDPELQERFRTAVKYERGFFDDAYANR
ncbi:TENA/THI-4 family protein [Bifidobacterium vansinderenii]|uniref:TENA/THI-4 family protein n=2 Tax=Bifidobacterium vansinderenii TaxID=1984871 RepID=A0A229VZL4_9BIFI|nr:TENA/THI-4 family protein [Bifidobacterium vansinderenii]